MIILTEVAEKLEKILNGEDIEVGPSGTKVVATNPTNYNFVVKTEGFHIDSIARPDRKGNFIPVFVSSMGGQFNPVQGIKQGSYSIPIVFYFPVRFKDDFFALGEYLVDAFVGTKLTYGEISGKAISNISVPQYGEIQNIDFTKFKTWVDANYEKTIETMEPYMTMNLTLFLSNAAHGLVFGNDFKADLTLNINNNTYTLEDLDWDGASVQSNTQANPEQEEGTNEAQSQPFGTSYGSSIKVYPKFRDNPDEPTSYEEDSGTYSETAIYYTRSGDNYVYRGHLTQQQYELYHQGGIALYIGVFTPDFYRELLKVWFEGNIQTVTCDFTFRIDGHSDLVFTRHCFIQSIVTPIEKGQIFALTLTFAKTEEEDD